MNSPAWGVTNYNIMFKFIKNDLPASIVVFFVALPLCLGIALASGAPLFSGLSLVSLEEL